MLAPPWARPGSSGHVHHESFLLCRSTIDSVPASTGCIIGLGEEHGWVVRTIRAGLRTGISCGRYYRRVSTTSGSLPSATVSTDHVSPAKECGFLQGFHLLRGPRGRCGRYINDLHGYTSIVQVNEGCYQAISRR